MDSFTGARSITTSKAQKIGIFVKLVSKSSWDGRIEESSRITCRWIFGRRWSKIRTLSVNSRPEFKNAEWSQLHEWHARFQGCRVSAQRTIPRSQSTRVFFIRRRYLEFAGNIGKRFANPPASSPSPYPGGFNPWISNVTEDTPVLTSTRGGPVTCGERQIPDTVLNLRFQTGPSAGNSFDPEEGRF